LEVLDALSERRRGERARPRGLPEIQEPRGGEEAAQVLDRRKRHGEGGASIANLAGSGLAHVAAEVQRPDARPRAAPGPVSRDGRQLARVCETAGRGDGGPRARGTREG